MKLTNYNFFDVRYKELYEGCLLNIKGIKGNNNIVTLNKGKKEYLLPIDRVNVLNFIQNKEINNKTLFGNGIDYNKTVFMAHSQRFERLNEDLILKQLTSLGKEIYLMNDYGKQLINFFNSNS